MICFVLSMMNAVFLVAMVDKKRKDQDRLFKFETKFKWLTPSTLYIPFEFNLMVCNFYIVKLGIFGRGFEFQIRWFNPNEDSADKSKKPVEKEVSKSKKQPPPQDVVKKKQNVKQILKKSVQPPNAVNSEQKPSLASDKSSLSTNTVLERVKSEKLKKVNEISMDLLSKVSKRDLSSTQATKTQLRRQHSLVETKNDKA